MANQFIEANGYVRTDDRLNALFNELEKDSLILRNLVLKASIKQEFSKPEKHKLLDLLDKIYKSERLAINSHISQIMNGLTACYEGYVCKRTPWSNFVEKKRKKLVEYERTL